jgi:hypothetical protein
VNVGRKIEGIVTERDFLRHLLGQNLGPNAVTSSSTVTKEIKAARPYDGAIWLLTVQVAHSFDIPVDSKISVAATEPPQ